MRYSRRVRPARTAEASTAMQYTSSSADRQGAKQGAQGDLCDARPGDPAAPPCRARPVLTSAHCACACAYAAAARGLLLTLAAREAHVQLVQVVLAAGRAGAPLNLARRCEACGRTGRQAEAVCGSQAGRQAQAMQRQACLPKPWPQRLRRKRRSCIGLAHRCPQARCTAPGRQRSRSRPHPPIVLSTMQGGPNCMSMGYGSQLPPRIWAALKRTTSAQTCRETQQGR